MRIDTDYSQYTQAELDEIRWSKSYIAKVMLRRFLQQFIKGNMADKKDFARYFANTFIYKCHKYNCKPRIYFDPLCRYYMNIERKRDDERALAHPEKSHAKLDVIIFASYPAYTTGGGQRPAQLAAAYTRMGLNVCYLYCQLFESIPIEGKSTLEYEHHDIYNVNPEELMNRCADGAVIIFEMPHQAFIPYLEEANRKKIATVFEIIDNWFTSLGKSFFNKQNYQTYLDKCDSLVVTARGLEEIVTGYTDKKVNYVANAYNESVFDYDKEYIKPSDMVTGEKTVLYYGALEGDWVDWKLIEECARKFSNYSFVMIGELKTDVLINKYAAYSNIHFIGAKEQKELPAYLKYSDFAIIPFKVDMTGKYVSPVKIFEYLAMHVYTVSTALPEILEYENVCASSDSSKWIECLKSGPIFAETDSFHDFLKENGWEGRCQKLIEIGRKDKE